MAARAEDAALERPRIAPLLEHGGVVVRLEHEDVRAVECRLHAARDEAEIRAGRHLPRPRDAVADGVGGIVRDGKRHDLHARDPERARRLAAQRLRNLRRQLRERRSPRVDGQLVPFRERAQPRDVVAVLVRDEDGVEVGRVDALGGERLFDARRADARVDEQTHAVHRDEDRVALAAAREYRYLHVLAPILCLEDVN